MTTNETRHEVVVDTEIARLWGEYSKAEAVVVGLADGIHYAAKDKKVYTGRSRQGTWSQTTDEALKAIMAEQANFQTPTYRQHELARKIERYAGARKALADALATVRREEKKYTGWTRFFLVSQTNGHIHSSMSCSTCYPTTQYGWLPQLSGLTEKDAVEEYGPRLCSVCFPLAPVEWMVGIESEKTYCEGSGTPASNTNGRRYASCGTCGTYVAVTQYGLLRKHAPKKEA